MRGAALMAALLACAVALASCGHENATPAGLRLQREDLVLACRELQRAEGPVTRELTAAKAVWPKIFRGLPADTASVTPALRGAEAAAAGVPLPTLFGEHVAVEFTGPAFTVVGLYRSFQGLTTRSWPLIVAAAEEIERGSPAARFAQENVAIYIESIYDAHFGLAQIGKKLLDGYRKLKGPAAFGSTLTQAEVEQLAAVYSEANARLQPHVAAKLGS